MLYLLVALLPAAAPVDYLRDVKPILTQRCAACHGALRQKAGLRLDAAPLLRKGGKHGPAVVPGKPGESLLLDAVTGNGRPRMPPESEGAGLTAEQIAALRAWIEQGAKAPDEPPPPDPRDHWSFRVPVRTTTPTAGAGWARNSIDAFLAAEQAKHGLTPRPPASKEALLRRVYFDLIGLPPTRQELHAFRADGAPDAYEKVVDRLLASPQYGERWGRHWMDVWRYSDWYGRRAVPDWWNAACQAWRWRDWIVGSLNADKGYDRMVQEMIAGDEVAPGDDSAAAATGFLARNWYALNYNQWMRDNVEHVGKAFLGLTFNCAHCHDHKYDPISQEEYFRFWAFFAPLELRQDRMPGEADPGPFKQYEYSVVHQPIKTGLVRVFDGRPEAETRMYHGGDERNKMTDKPPVAPAAPTFLGGDRIEIKPVALPPVAYNPGRRPFVRQEERQKVQAALDAAKALLDRVRSARMPALGALAAGSGLAPAFRAAPRFATLAEEAAATRQRALEARIAADDAQAAAPAGAAPPLSPVYPKTSTGRRKALAEWITARTNPLTARVAVNHIWMRHFGKPLVASVFDFGRNGKSPTHPELLDWLAVELRDGGWRMKPLHRLIVTSAAYRTASAVGGAAELTKDPDNRWLWHFPTRRLEAEAVRDAVLHAAGELDFTMGGLQIEVATESASKRRSLYFETHPEEGGHSKFRELFDAPDPCECYRRTESLLPQQALALTNGPLTHHCAGVLARKLIAESPDESEWLIAAFEQVLARGPTSAERATAAEFLKKQAELYQSGDSVGRARESLLRALFAHNDFVTVR